jgi:hypothetical protein
MERTEPVEIVCPLCGSLFNLQLDVFKLPSLWYEVPQHLDRELSLRCPGAGHPALVHRAKVAV